MPYITASGVQIPTGTDAFSPTAQLKTMGDKLATYDNRVVVALDTDRTALASPVLRDGLEVYVTGTNKTWQYEDTTWVEVPLGDTGWITATLQSSWQNASGTETVKYRRLNGVVYLTGRPFGGSTGTALTLPVGFRPAQIKRFAVTSADTTTIAKVNVNTDGTVTLTAGVQPDFAPVSFPADA